ncbi:MAG: ligase-associated DNA damage response exonuclease [Bacteroidota bacterium]|nr:ligase-associated DNA damage response exonuclease [Bacteroidota bacterium]
MAVTPILEFNKNGIFCPIAGFYIDPWLPVEKAIITHAHSDHARWGNQFYLSHKHSSSILKTRLGSDIKLETLDYGQPVSANGVKITLYPAGHIYGSAQVRLEYKGEVSVVSGDYKLENDFISEPFEPIKCDTFVTESTFGLPIFKWKPQAEVFSEINAWWNQNQDEGKTSIIFGYSLGKAQRILKNIDHSIGPIFVHGAIYNCNNALINDGAPLPYFNKAGQDQDTGSYKNSLIIAPPSAAGTSWMKKFKPYRTAIASGWMNLRGPRRRRAVDRGFILSDHADWPDLLKAVEATEAQKIYVTHGYTASFARLLIEKGLEANEVSTQFEGELAEITEIAEENS